MSEDRDLDLMGRAIALSAEAAQRGDACFGAVVADAEGVVLAAVGSTARTSGDPLAHAAIEAVRAAEAAGGMPPGATLYASGEPCAMCATALFRAGLRRVAFAGGAAPGLAPGLGWSCAEVLAAASEPVELVGPLLRPEAEAVRDLFWRHRAAR